MARLPGRVQMVVVQITKFSLDLSQMAQLALIVMHGELHIHGGAGIVLILDLSLSQSGLVMVAPVHGLQALVDVALLVHLAKDLDLLGLKAGIHGLVGVLPVGHHAQALEALHLDADILLGIGVAGGTEVGHAHGLAVELLLLDDGALDGHTVVIPAGDIRGVPATHGVGPDDEVLQGLVQGVAHVEAAVGERRAVVKGEAGLALVLLQQLVVEVHVLPALEHLRLPLGQTRPHGEVGLGQIDGLVVIHDASPFIFVSFPSVPDISVRCEGSNPSRRSKTKNALPLNSETKRLKTLCGTTLLAGPLAERGHSRLPLQADGITPVTRPRLLASSFSRRLQGDFHRRACPPRTKRRLSLQTFDRLLFLFFAKYPVTRLSYHISAVCQPYFPGFSPKNV